MRVKTITLLCITISRAAAATHKVISIRYDLTEKLTLSIQTTMSLLYVHELILLCFQVCYAQFEFFSIIIFIDSIPLKFRSGLQTLTNMKCLLYLEIIIIIKNNESLYNGHDFINR